MPFDSIGNSFMNIIDDPLHFPGPVLEACMPCFQRSKDDAGVYNFFLGVISGAISTFNAFTNKTIDGPGTAYWFCYLLISYPFQLLDWILHNFDLFGLLTLLSLSFLLHENMHFLLWGNSLASDSEWEEHLCLIFWTLDGKMDTLLFINVAPVN
ncbi:hypothetical protein Q3G72_005876 [Acer saccharum]|nr:hypothetical protein Q3G72_005876 [Acer saccharum]